MAVAAGRGTGADRSWADRPGPSLLAAAGSAIAATTLACAVVLVVRRTQVPFDTSGVASLAAVFAGVLLVAAVDLATFRVGPPARTLGRVAVRLGLALILAATLPGPAALLGTLSHPPRFLATAAVVALAFSTLIAPGIPSRGWFAPASVPPRDVRPKRRDRSTEAPPATGRGLRKGERPPLRPSPQVEIPAETPRVPVSPPSAQDAPPIDSGLAEPGIIQQRFERYLLPGERIECLRGTLHLAVVAGSRLATGHVGFCPPFHHLPHVEVGTSCEEVEATIVAAEILPWGTRVECRLDAPADETILIPIDVLARAPLPAIDAPPPSSHR